MRARRVGTVRRAALAALIVGVLALAGCSGGAVSQGSQLVGKRLVAIADDADGFLRIFDKQPTGSEAAGLSGLFRKAEDVGLDVLIASGGVRQADLVVEALADPATSYLTLVGHNAAGSFRFADGSALELASLAPAPGKVVAVISCESSDFVTGTTLGVPDPLTYQVAFRTEQLFTAGLTVAMLTDTAAAQQLLTQSFQRAAAEVTAKRFAIYTVVGLPPVAGVVGLAIVEQR